MRACILPRRAQPASSTLRPPLPVRCVPHARLHEPRPASLRRPAAGTRADSPPTHTCCSGTLGQPRRSEHAPAPRHPRPHSHADTCTSRGGALGEGRPGTRGRSRARPRAACHCTAALQVQDPLTLGLTRQLLVPGSGTGLSRHPAFPAHWAGWAPGQGGSGLEGWAAAPHPQTPARSQLLQGAKGRCMPGLACVEGRSADCRQTGETLVPSQSLLAQTSARSVRSSISQSERLCPFSSSSLPPILLCS